MLEMRIDVVSSSTPEEIERRIEEHKEALIR